MVHHGDQEVEQQDDHDGDEDKELYLADDLVAGVLHPLPDEAHVAQGHEEHRQDGLHGVGHRVGVAWGSADLLTSGWDL